jgi:hypothetical protein
MKRFLSLILTIAMLATLVTVAVPTATANTGIRFYVDVEDFQGNVGPNQQIDVDINFDNNPATGFALVDILITLPPGLNWGEFGNYVNAPANPMNMATWPFRTYSATWEGLELAGTPSVVAMNNAKNRTAPLRFPFLNGGTSPWNWTEPTGRVMTMRLQTDSTVTTSTPLEIILEFDGKPTATLITVPFEPEAWTQNGTINAGGGGTVTPTPTSSPTDTPDYGDDVIVPSTEAQYAAAINLTKEIYQDFPAVADFPLVSINLEVKPGKSKWVAYNPNKRHELSRMLNKGWISLKFSDKAWDKKAKELEGAKAENENERPKIITFTKVEPRPKANLEKVAPWYGTGPERDSTWILSKKGKTFAAPASPYDFAPTSNGKTPDEPGWTRLREPMTTPESGRVRWLFRSPATGPALGGTGKFVPASRAFRLQAVTYVKAPNYKVPKEKKGEAVLNLKKGDFCTIDGVRYGSATAKTAIKINATSPLNGKKAIIWKAANGKKPCSLEQELDLPTVAAAS